MKTIFGILLVTTLFNSCKRLDLLSSVQNDSTELRLTTKAQELERFLTADSEGNFFIYSSTDGSVPSSSGFSVMGCIIDPKTGNNIPYGNLTIGSTSIPLSPSNNEYSQSFNAGYFGQTVTISLDEVGSSNNEFTKDLYFPASFDLSSLSIPDPLAVGSTIAWNSDTNNALGIIILLEANLGDYLSDPSSWDINGNRTERMIYIDNDNGSYTISSDDLKGLNRSSNGNNGCLVSLIRGDYAMVCNANSSALNSKLLYQISSPKNFVKIN